MSAKVSAYDVNAGWTSLLDHFNVDVNGTSRSDDAMSFTGARAAYTTTYVASLSTAAFHCGASGPSYWDGQASYLGVRGEARMAKVHGPVDRERG